MMGVSRVSRMISSLALAVLFATVYGLPVAADYDAGKRAWDAGKPVEALAQWRAAADAGDRRAMLELGRLYRMGFGAPQDYVLAHMWFNLAAGRGEMDALKERDALAEKMTPQQVAAAQDRARAWRPGGVSGGAEAAVSAQQASGPLPARAIREAQELLKALGYEPGPADGKWGARSARAYAAFLRDAGSPSGETLSPEGLRAMRAAAKRQRAGTGSGSGVGAPPPRPAVKALPQDALHRLVLAGDVTGLKAALKVGADVNARDKQGWTALMHAAYKGYALLAGPLLEAKADPNVRSAETGVTALFIALALGHPEVIELLVKAGADVNARDKQGWTGLMRAADQGRALLAEWLLEAEADPDMRAADGTTALFMAAVQGHLEVIELLMKAGADVSIRGPKGKTALEVVRARYGDAGEAREKSKSRAVAALLEAKTWAEVERRRNEFEQRWAVGKEFRDCADCPEMVVIPAGKFMMGSPEGETGRARDEGPQHEVKITRRFAVGKYEVTRAEYGKFVKETNHSVVAGCSWRNPGLNQGEREPVVCVNWDDAKAYLAWLSDKTGKEYRLLSEPEWEYVARTGTTTRRYWGEDAGDTGWCRHVNGAGSESSFQWRDKACSDGYKRTAPVGSFSSNDWGLHDVIGNVWEWVEDCWHEDYSGAPTDGSAWRSGGDCGKRVLRGGSWASDPRDFGSADRNWFPTGDRSSGNGFRIARTLIPL